MGDESSGQEDRETPSSQPTPTWIKVIDRILWGANAPRSRADRSRRLKEIPKNLLSAAKWVGNRFFS